MRKLKGFTLVEILIVIVIIGILIGALVPRMQSAQGRARDVARKNDLSQLQAAIVTSFQDKGDWPQVSSAYDNAVNVSALSTEILAAGMNGVPKDPLKGSTFKGLGSEEGSGGEYRYMVVDSYGSSKGGFVLMAKTEVEGGSNWVVCDQGEATTKNCDVFESQAICKTGDHTSCNWQSNACTGTYTSTAGAQGILEVNGTSHPDVQTIKPCASLSKTASANSCSNGGDGSDCTYSNESQLRYILIN